MKIVEEKREKGRPSLYSDELADKMCDVIADHYESDEDLCSMYDFFPQYRTFCRWVSKHPYFSQAYMRAKITQVERRLDHVQRELVCDTQDYITHNNRLYFNNARMARLRILAGYNQWRAAKLIADKYGEKKTEEEVKEVRRDLNAMKDAVQKKRDAL